jgi:hypothetical protein
MNASSSTQGKMVQGYNGLVDFLMKWWLKGTLDKVPKNRAFL